MIVIADTTPVNYLILIGEVELLSHLFSRIILPEAVLTELRHQKAPAAVQRWASTLPAWAEVRQVQIPIEMRMQGLGAGESEAIALAETGRRTRLNKNGLQKEHLDGINSPSPRLSPPQP